MKKLEEIYYWWVMNNELTHLRGTFNIDLYIKVLEAKKLK